MFTSIQMLMFVNFFFLSLALLGVYYYAFRLKMELKRSNHLRKEAEKYQQLFNSTSDGVFQTDLDGNFLLINDGGAKIFGFESAEECLQSKFINSDFHGDSSSREEYIHKILENGGLESQLIKCKKRNGEFFYAELSAHVKRDDIDQEIIGFEGIFRDVTQRIKLEEELRQYSENLEKIVKEKTEEVLSLERKRIQLENLASLGEMVATIVHEIRNPLSSIKVGLTALLKRTQFEEKDKQCLELACLEVTFLEHFLRDLLNFAKPLELKSLTQNINLILDMALAQMDENFRLAKIKVKRKFAPNLPKLHVDARRLHQVFFNIFLNALEALKNGGTIIVRTEYVSRKKMVRVELVDNGQGIDEQVKEEIFKPFYSTKVKGTGLGLTVVQKVIEAHGGHVSIESKTGKGTKVTLELPANDA